MDPSPSQPWVGVVITDHQDPMTRQAIEGCVSDGAGCWCMRRSIYFYCYCCKNVELKSNGVLDGRLFIVLDCN